ncbi:MAG TPA: grasp-with-spasm system SPASM domain peptide maturase [Bacteroidales bacterium]|jgi:SPASM domain peptide maturase of grasp-with-spasm system|nr:grasp-with-spasm system SPASM domain peptide maturase [Bacteroidales bacterium]
MQKLKVKFFEDAKVIKGYCRGIILDLTRQSYKFVPNSLVDLVLECDGLSTEEIKKHYNNQYDSVIHEYIDFLIQNEFAFYADNPSLFPRMSLSWHSSSLISNAIICDKQSNHNYRVISDCLDQLNCKGLQLRFFYPITDLELIDILKEFVASKIKGIEIILPYSSSRTNSNYHDLVKLNPRITSFFLYSSIHNDVCFLDNGRTLPLCHNSNNIVDDNFCGVIHPNNFIVNKTFFCESNSYNGCLNRKIAIDTNGDIKNCPSSEKSFGNIKDTTIRTVLDTLLFKELWKITKDQIEVCKDCEFRYICMDCRVFIKDKNNIYSQPAKCTYNPYIAKWQGQKGYISVEDWLIVNHVE